METGNENPSHVEQVRVQRVGQFDDVSVTFVSVQSNQITQSCSSPGTRRTPATHISISQLSGTGALIYAYKL
jgi:hypothetical protein